MSEQKTSSFSIRLIRRFCRKELAEEIEGNLIEYYAFLNGEGKRFVKLYYWYEVFNYLRPSLLKFFTHKNKGPMFIFNPKIAVRNLIRHKSSTVISLLGFIVGLTSVIFLYFYIENELNYDAFHTDKDQIYRILRTSVDNSGSPYKIAITSAPYAEALKNDYAETIYATNRVFPQNGLVTYGTNKFYENKMIFTDENFFQFFSYPLKTGDPASVLEGSHHVVISQKLAKKYFGKQDPIGEILTVDNEYKFTVTGILDDLPNKSHLDFDMVFSIRLFEKFSWFDGWWNNNLATYIKVKTEEEATNLDIILPDFMEKYLGEDFQKYNTKLGLTLEPLSNVYFNDSAYEFPQARRGDRSSVIVLGSVALAILFVACFNYINLSIAQSYQRAKEVGVRKVLGVEKNRLVVQFMGESFLILLLAILVSVTLSELLKFEFNEVFDLHVFFDWSDPMVLYFSLGLIGLVVLASGLYPALLLSSFDPLKVLKTGKPLLGRNLLVRKGLVISQFALSIFLIIVTMFIYAQMHYVKNKDLGYDQQAVLLINNNNTEIDENYKAFQEALIRHAYVENVTVTSGEPGGFHDVAGMHLSGLKEPVRMNTVFADPFYLETFDIQVVAGRGFDDRLAMEREHAMMISEAALKATGLSVDEILGRDVHVPYWEYDRKVVGVFKDYHFKTLKKEIEPLAIIMGEDVRKIAVKVSGKELVTTVRNIEEEYKRFAPNFPMDSQFLDDSLTTQYEVDEQQVKVFVGFSIISIFLASMGIFGLAAFSAKQRQKELGIRKVLGAKINQVILLISKEFIILVGMASLVAIPFSWYFTNYWLANFAYRIDVWSHWPIFIIGSLLTTVIAFLTIGVKTYKTAAGNPTESIRYE